MEDNKFEHFKPVMDAYITGHFAAALVYKYENLFQNDTECTVVNMCKNDILSEHILFLKIHMCCTCF